MKYSREYILQRAFEVFMNKGYDSTSITVLQKELEMSRGAMYRYFTSKEDLLKSVIDEYFFNLFNKLILKEQHSYTLPEFIEYVCRRQKFVVSRCANKGFTSKAFLNYTALIIQAAKHYTGFIKRFKELHSWVIENWKKAVENSIEKGQLKKDVDVDILGVLFCNISMEDTFSENCDENELLKNAFSVIDYRQNIMVYMYNLIKLE